VSDEKPKEVVQAEAPKPEQTQAPEPTIGDLMKVIMALAAEVKVLKSAPALAPVAPRSPAVRVESVGQPESNNAIHPGDVTGIPIREIMTSHGSKRLDY
jgi:hypothetical protein